MLTYLIFILFGAAMCCWILAGRYLFAAACFVGAIALSIMVEYAQALRELRKAAPAPKAHAVTAARQAEEYAIAGTAQYQDAIIALCEETAEYGLSKSEIIDAGMDGERIYRYQIQHLIEDHVQLIPEPDNPHDANAIRVELDGVHVGYIKRGHTNKIHELLNRDGIDYMYIELVGGPYKIISEDEEQEGKYVTETNSDFTIGLRLLITLRD